MGIAVVMVVVFAVCDSEMLIVMVLVMVIAVCE